MPQTLYNALLITPTETIEQGAVVISDEGRIAYAGPMKGAPRVYGTRLDMQGRMLIPGLIDIHVHGGKGLTFGTLGHIAEDLRIYSEWVASTGVVGFLCSIAAPDAQTLAKVVRSCADALNAGVPGAEALGLHLEGPFLSEAKRGAFNPAWLRPPALDEVEAVLKAGRGFIRQVTMAPELPGVQEVAARFRAAGVVVALGHTDADYETARNALCGDFTHVTHTFNGQRGFQHREPGTVGAIMASDGVTAELIADMVHVHPAAMKVLIRCLGIDRVVLITDAMAGAGLSDGSYELVGQSVIVKNGQARLADGGLAGSTATLNQCVRNIHREVGVLLPQAIQMASLNPARAMGFSNRLGSIAVGKDASLTGIDEQVNIYLTMVKGRIVYNSL